MNFFSKIRSFIGSLSSERQTDASVDPYFSVSEQVEWDRRVADADRARDTGQFEKAAKLFCYALELRDDRGIHIQAGHMFKEAGFYDNARTHYDIAYSRDPDDPEISFQLGHFYKLLEQYEDALFYYKAALTFAPDWDGPLKEIESLEGSSELRRERAQKSILSNLDDVLNESIKIEDLTSPLLDGSLVAQSYDDLTIDHQPAFVPTRNGTPQTTEWGRGLTVRGITALRGYLVSAIPLERIEISMDGKLFHVEQLTVAHQPREKTNPDIRKYCYNAWVDFTDVESGWHDFIFRARSPNLDEVEGHTWRRERLIVAPPFDQHCYRQSDAVLAPLDKASSLSIVEQINARPSILHRCNTSSFPFEIKTVAVMRPDQLGDLVASVPALHKIREALPNAKIVGILSSANVGLAKTLGIFDAIELIDFPDDPIMYERVMSLENQIKMKNDLAHYKFDLAIDLPVSANSHKLLPLLNAPITVGFGGPRKSMDLNFSSYDPSTGCDFVKHSARTAIIGEAIALAVDSGARVERRNDITRETLVPYGIPSAEPYIVIHSGARIKFTHWPHYTELAERIARDMSVRIVYMAENESQKSQLPQDMLDSGQIVYVCGHMPFDHFDTFLSFATVFVGNDSGPKHLASLRGARVVSLHSSRIGWEEWGQERGGIAITRQVPCAGCSLHHNFDECSKNTACITLITVDEVYSAVFDIYYQSEGLGNR